MRSTVLAARIAAVPAPAKVILFGSHTRGDADEHSDFDFLVIEAKGLNEPSFRCAMVTCN